LELALTTNNLPASTTIPVLSKTPFADNTASNSKNSSLPGVAVSHTANRTLEELDPLLHNDTVNTENVPVGHVYTVVSLAAAKSAVPNLPVAII
jgi:hypothetical protein